MAKLSLMNTAIKTYEDESGRIMVETKPGQAVSLGAAVQLGIISTAEHARILNAKAADERRARL